MGFGRRHDRYVDFSPPATAFVSANIAATATAPYTVFGSSPGNYVINQFGEAAINLKALFTAAGEPCFTATTIFIRTKSSTSLTAELKDMIAPFPLNLTTKPLVDAGTDLSLCSQGATTQFSFSGTVTPGSASIVSAAWSTATGPVVISNPSFSGGVVTATATVTGAAATGAVTLSATATDGCVTSQTINLTVKPAPPVNSVSNRTHCNGDSATGIAFSSSVAGATFSWTSDAEVGFGTSGSSDIPAYSAVNNGNAPVTATVSVIATLNGCSGPATTFTVTVNPTPSVNSIGNRLHCAGANAPGITFGGSVIGTTFDWTSSADVGFGTAGSGNIGGFVAANALNAPVTATVTVTPSVNGCAGPSTSFMVTVNPAATVI